MLDVIPEKFRKCDYEVRSVIGGHARATRFIEKHHYALGCSKTSVYVHGLYLRNGIELLGVAMWLPPTRVAAESVNKENWRQVLSLTRLAIHPLVPTNGASFLLAASRKLIAAGRRFHSLVTYADEFMNHTGQIYLADNWTYCGAGKPTPRWEDKDGRQVSKLATRTRTSAEMIALGYTMVGSYRKHKFIKHLRIQKRSLLDDVEDWVDEAVNRR